MCIYNVETTPAQDPPDAGDPSHIIQRSVHQHGVNRKTLLLQALGQLGMGLTYRFEMMAATPHGKHHAIDVLLLAAEVRCRFGMEDARSEEHTSALQSRERLVCRL